MLNGDDSLETRKDVANIFLDLCQDDKIKEFAQILLDKIETLQCPEGIFEATNYTFCFGYDGKPLTLSIDRNDEYIVTNIAVYDVQ